MNKPPNIKKADQKPDHYHLLQDIKRLFNIF